MDYATTTYHFMPLTQICWPLPDKCQSAMSLDHIVNINIKNLPLCLGFIVSKSLLSAVLIVSVISSDYSWYSITAKPGSTKVPLHSGLQFTMPVINLGGTHEAGLYTVD